MHSLSGWVGLWAWVLLGCGGCSQFRYEVDGGAGERGFRVVQVESPAGEASGGSNLVRGADGRVYLSWIEPGVDATHSLRFSAWVGDSWSAARTIATGDDWFVNWADFPSMAALADGTLAASWLEMSGPGTFSYDVRLSVSGDGGASWSEPVTPHGDGVKTEHGFVSLVPLTGDRFGVFWLDGRNLGGGHGEAKGEMALHTAALYVDGRVAHEEVVDSRVCECCQTSAAVAGGGDALVVYRDRSEDEVRDIGIVRTDDLSVGELRGLHVDGWRIHGCPVNGPAIATSGDRTAVAWFTLGSEGKGRVKLIVSDDGGRSFGEPVVVDEGRPLGRVDVVLLSDGSAAVSWVENGESGAEIRVRTFGAGSPADGSTMVARTSRGTAAGFPRMASLGDRVIVSWTETDEPARIRTALLVGR